MGGELGPTLRRLREEGVSFELIGRQLENEHDVRVSTTTVRRWCHHFGIDVEQEAS